MVFLLKFIIIEKYLIKYYLLAKVLNNILI
jgi:hypothetical protein